LLGRELPAVDLAPGRELARGLGGDREAGSLRARGVLGQAGGLEPEVEVGLGLVGEQRGGELGGEEGAEVLGGPAGEGVAIEPGPEERIEGLAAVGLLEAAQEQIALLVGDVADGVVRVAAAEVEVEDLIAWPLG